MIAAVLITFVVVLAVMYFFKEETKRLEQLNKRPVFIDSLTQDSAAKRSDELND
tara:strand:+ start:410 stop:571 length:162 start_codon:yes stop_codon:yes gene_type:complete